MPFLTDHREYFFMQISITVNGKKLEISEGTDVKTLVEQQGFSVVYVAVERNGEIVPKNSYSETVLMPEDVIEIVQFVGGG